MALTNASRHRLRVWLISGVVAAIVGLGVGGVVLTQSEEYEARVGVVAVPVSQEEGGTAQYGEVVSLALPALTELARSPSVLDRVSESVPGSPPGDDLFGAVTVELIPASGVARLIVRSDSERLAAELVESLTRSVIASDVLAPAARLRALDTTADVEQVAPDTRLGLGLALVAAVLAGIAMALYLRPFRSRRTAASGILAALAEAGKRPVAILDGRDPVLVDRILVLQQAAHRPLRVVAVGPGMENRVDTLSGSLAENEAQLSVNGDASQAAVVAVMDRRRTKPDELTSAVNALPNMSLLVAVVLE